MDHGDSYSMVDSFEQQEAQLSLRDRAMRRVNWNLAIATQQCRNYLSTTSPEQIEVMKLEG